MTGGKLSFFRIKTLLSLGLPFWGSIYLFQQRSLSIYIVHMLFSVLYNIFFYIQKKQKSYLKKTVKNSRKTLGKVPSKIELVKKY